LNNGRDSERVEGFADDIGRLQRIVRSRGTTVEVLDTLRDSLGLAGSIATLDAQRVGMNRAAQHDDLVAIAQLAALHPDPAGFEPWLRSALGRPRRADGVTLATVHRVKGLEWPTVVVHLADSDQFPHRLAEDVEEERRLFHVALTRASREVTIVVDETPSPFIRQLLDEPPAQLEPEPVVRRPAAPAPARSARPGHDLTGTDAKLFEALRDLRRHLAAGKPAYTVLADAALQDIATRRPTSLAQLASIHGIGPTKLDRYGAALLAVVEDHPTP
jgi:DNA helicase-2/ATP-dependent DNA helicase PcrA